VIRKRTYVGELEWAIDQIRRVFSDRNPNREAQVQAALAYAQEVSSARTGSERIPERPRMGSVV
jgi:hypothetical protein